MLIPVFWHIFWELTNILDVWSLKKNCLCSDNLLTKQRGIGSTEPPPLHLTSSYRLIGPLTKKNVFKTPGKVKSQGQLFVQVDNQMRVPQQIHARFTDAREHTRITRRPQRLMGSGSEACAVIARGCGISKMSAGRRKRCRLKKPIFPL